MGSSWADALTVRSLSVVHGKDGVNPSISNSDGCFSPHLVRGRMINSNKQCEPVRGEGPRGTRDAANCQRCPYPLILTTDQLVVIGRAPSQRYRLGVTVRGRVHIEPCSSGIVEKA